jgi:hypothetical protein
MQVNSYVFKSPYPQAVQVGQRDPSSEKKEDQSQALSTVENQKRPVSEGKVNPTLNSGITVSVSALQSGNAQNSVSEFKSLMSINQGQKVYSQES